MIPVTSDTALQVIIGYQKSLQAAQRRIDNLTRALKPFERYAAMAADWLSGHESRSLADFTEIDVEVRDAEDKDLRERLHLEPRGSGRINAKITWALDGLTVKDWLILYEAMKEDAMEMRMKNEP